MSVVKIWPVEVKDLPGHPPILCPYCWEPVKVKGYYICWVAAPGAFGRFRTDKSYADAEEGQIWHVECLS